MEKYHASFGSVVYWGPSTGLLALVGSIAMLLKIQDSRRIQKLLEENRTLVANRERERISRELHDHLGNDLAQIALNVKGLPVAREGKEDLNAIVSSSREALQKVRQLIWITDPEEDTLKKLLLYIGDCASSLARSGGLNLRLSFSDEIPETPVSAEWRHAVFSSVKELAANAVKHSSAKTLCVKAETFDEFLTITVSDDGVGFNKEVVNSSQNGGLKNVGTRVKELAGSFRMTSSLGEGSEACLTVPLPKRKSNGKTT